MPKSFPRVGVGVLVIREGKILLGKRLGDHMPGFYAAPGGHLEHGESFTECAKREVLEETGLETNSIRLLMVGNYLFGDKHYVDIDMIAEAAPGNPQTLEPHKCAGWQWYNPENLPTPLFIVTKRMIDAYINGFSLAAASDELFKQ